MCNVYMFYTDADPAHGSPSCDGSIVFIWVCIQGLINWGGIEPGIMLAEEIIWSMLVTATTQASIRLWVKESQKIFLNKLSMLARPM